jgi:hypothetical protein
MRARHSLSVAASTDGFALQGAKIRGTYIKWAAGEKNRLEDELERKRGEVREKEGEVERARSECCTIPWFAYIIATCAETEQR